MIAAWAEQGVGDPQRRVGCQVCSRLAGGVPHPGSLPSLPPACKVLFCQWVLAALWHRLGCFGGILGPWHAPLHQGTLLGELLLMPQPLPLHSVG